MSAADLTEIAFLSLRVSFASTALILVPGVALGWLFARARFRGRSILRAVVLLPMVLPPVAIGLVLLVTFSHGSFVGDLVERVFGASLLLTFWAAVVAAAVMSFPLLVVGAQQGFEAVPRRLEHVAATLGARPARIFARVTLPLAARGILYGVVFAFVRGLGEFGATALVAGHVPGKTETLSMAIYARIESFDDAGALALSAVALVLAFSATALAEAFLRRRPER